MSKTYRVCNGTTPVDITTTLSTVGTCAFWYEVIKPTYETQFYRQQYRLTLSQTSPVSFTYNYIETYNQWVNGVLVQTHTFNVSRTIPSGVLTYDWYETCEEDYREPHGDYSRERSTYAEGNQINIPICYVSPTCQLTITGTTINAPTLRGEDNGSVNVRLSGATGGTINYYVNGALYTTIASSNVNVTGLTSGNYNILVNQGICNDSVDVVVPEGEFRTGDFTINEPNEITAVENPIILTLETALNSNSPLQSINYIYVTGNTISAVTLTFNLTFPYVYNAEFKSKGYPDRNTYFLETTLRDSTGVPQGTNTNAEICTSLTECLQNDSILNQYYFISNSGTTITMTSKEYGDMYDLDNTNLTIAGTGITFTNAQSGVVAYDGQLTSNYSLYVELFVNNDLQFGGTPVLNQYERVAEIELPFNNTNVHKFNLNTILKNFVSSPMIDFNMTGFTTSPSMDTTYFCKYGEKYPLIPNTNTKKKRYKGITDVKYTLNSALNFEDNNDMSTYLGTPISTGSTTYTGITFLNAAPNPKYIPRGSKEFLYYLLRTQYPNALSLRGDIYYYNGTSQTGITFFNITTLTGATNFGGVTVLAAGYDALGLDAYENSGNTKIRRVDFAVWQTPPSGSTTQLTETRSYLFEIDEQPQKFDVAFLNKLGTYETFSFVGEVVEGEEITRQTLQKPFTVGLEGQASLGFEYNSVYDTEYTKTWTVNSGIVDSNTYDFLMQLLQSNKIYNYSNPYENFLTVIGHTATKSTNTAEYSVQVIFKETIYENSISI